MVRAALYAGTLYTNNFDVLDKEIHKAFLDEPGPGSLPKTRDNTSRIAGLVAPCGPLKETGYSMAWAYKELAEQAVDSPIIILGTNYNSGRSCLSLDDWETPFGLLHVNKELGEYLHKQTGIQIDEKEHLKNYSIEVQLPFIQFACRDKLTSTTIVPILIGNDISLEQIDVLVDALTQYETKPILICSSNLVHFGEQYNYTPFVYNIKESIENIDYHCIDCLQRYDAKELIEFVEKEDTTIFGAKTLAFFLRALEKLYESPELILKEYYTSTLFNAESKDSVSYISMTPIQKKE
jgi:AmmeMemoRadiSam system protein B